jgi:hypothetical protein
MITSGARVVHRGGKRPTAEVDDPTLDERSRIIDDEPKPAALVEERQPIPAGILVNTAFAQTRDRAIPHQRWNARRFKVETIGDNLRVKLDLAVLNFDPGPGETIHAVVLCLAAGSRGGEARLAEMV